MKTLITLFFAIISFSAQATSVCSISPVLTTTLNNKPFLDVSCTNPNDSYTFISEGNQNFALQANNLRPQVVKYLLDLGYTPIDSTTFRK